MSESERVWSTFEAKTCDSVIKLRIQDMPKHRLEDVANLFTNYFATEETMHKAAGVPKSQDALEECRGFVTEMINDPTVSAVICCRNDSQAVEDIIGASLMRLCKKGDPEEEGDFTVSMFSCGLSAGIMMINYSKDLQHFCGHQMAGRTNGQGFILPKTKEMGKMFDLMGIIFSKYDAMKELNIDCFYDDRGVVVHPNYRGLGIAQKLLNVRRLICRDKGVPMTGAWVTSFGSQKAAERDGWETTFEVSYEEFGKEHEIVFENVPRTCKFVVAKCESD